MKDGSEEAPPEDAPEEFFADVPLEEQQMASLKMQSAFRGKQARKQVEEMKIEKEENDAAVKVQAIFKGNQARKEVQEMKDEN